MSGQAGCLLGPSGSVHDAKGHLHTDEADHFHSQGPVHDAEGHLHSDEVDHFRSQVGWRVRCLLGQSGPVRDVEARLRSDEVGHFHSHFHRQMGGEEAGCYRNGKVLHHHGHPASVSDEADHCRKWVGGKVGHRRRTWNAPIGCDNMGGDVGGAMGKPANQSPCKSEKKTCLGPDGKTVDNASCRRECWDTSRSRDGGQL
jgi:hypothetical protein